MGFLGHARYNTRTNELDASVIRMALDRKHPTTDLYDCRPAKRLPLLLQESVPRGCRNIFHAYLYSNAHLFEECCQVLGEMDTVFIILIIVIVNS